MSTTAKNDLDLPAPSTEPAHVWAEIRGIKYKFTELPIGEYDKLVNAATQEKTDPESGVTYDDIDNSLLMRLMIPKVVEPQPDGKLLGTGTRMYRAFARIINDLHFGDEPVVLLDDDGNPKAKVEAKGDDSGNA